MNASTRGSSTLTVTASSQETAPPKLRVGVVLDCTRVSRWVAAVLDELDRTDFITTVIVLSGQSSRQPSIWGEVKANPAAALFALWTRWDYRHWRSRQKDAFEIVDLAERRNRLTILPGRSVPERDPCDAFKTGTLDLVLNFSSVRDITSTAKARFGIWSFEQSATGYRPIGARFQELTEGRGVADSIRIQVSDAAGDHVIASAAARVDTASLFRFQNAACWKLPRFLVRQLAELHRNSGAPQSMGKSEEVGGSPPRNAAMVSFMAGWAWRGLRVRFLRERWFIAYRDKKNPGRARLIMPSYDRFYADPFVFDHAGRNYIFFEDYRYSAGKALISFVEVDGRGICSDPQVVLERDYHLSYPFLFRLDGNIYLLPETADSGRVELYRGDPFPRRWVLERVLIDNLVAVDPTLFRHAGKLWLFACRRDGNDELLLFYADSLLGPWKQHPQNPIVSDVRRARPAGQLFYRYGELIRPSQDCSRAYGYAVVLNRIQKLTTTEYDETPIARILPSWHPGNRGTHTLNENTALQVVDGRVLMPAPLAWLPGLGNKQRKDTPSSQVWHTRLLGSNTER